MSSLAPQSLTVRDLEVFLHDKFPLARAMGVHVAETTAARLVLEAPLAANINHLGTAFGGSLHALPTLACYAGLWMLMREAGVDGHVVVKHSEAFYRTPVTGSLRAVWVRPPAALVTEFILDLQRHKKARMDLASIVEGTNGQSAVDYRGSFVALI